MYVGMVAGEASGDLLGSSLLSALNAKVKNITADGIGGSSMIAQGFNSLFPLEKLSLHGIIEPLFHLRELFSIRKTLYQHFTKELPNVFVGIDAPDFNLGLELKLKQHNIPTVHYVSPSVWAWRQKRVHKIAKATNLMLTLFPFETCFYEQHRVPALFVGHPLADAIPLQSDRQSARAALGLDSKSIYIAILPGSRHSEIKNVLPSFLRTAALCKKKLPEVKFISNMTNAVRAKEFTNLHQRLVPNIDIELFQNKSQQVMAAADILLIASGTATLEAMLIKRPMVIAYQLSWLTFQIAKHLVKTPYIGLPNLLANELVVPEFIQHQATPEQLSHSLLQLLENDAAQKKLKAAFTDLHTQLRCNASVKAAEAIISIANRTSL